MSPNEGFAAGIAKRSPKERLAWALKGAPLRTRDLRLSSLGAVVEGRKLRDSITEKMRRVGLDPLEAVVALVFARNDHSALCPFFPVIDVEPSPTSELETASKTANEVPIGFLVAVWDKQEGSYEGNVFLHARPLLVDARSIALNEQAVRVYGRYIKTKLFGEHTN